MNGKGSVERFFGGKCDIIDIMITPHMMFISYLDKVDGSHRDVGRCLPQTVSHVSPYIS